MKKLRKLFKKNNQLLVFFLLLFCFVECDLYYELKGGRYNVYEDHPILQEGDTLVYVSDFGTVDSLRVMESAVYQQGDRDGNEAKSYWGEFKQINGDTPEPVFTIYLDIDMYNVDYHFPFSDSSNAPRVTFDQLKKDNDKYKLSLYNVEFDDLFFLSFTCYDNVVCEVESALYSMKYGILQYSLYSGEIFTLSQQTLEMLMAREQ